MTFSAEPGEMYHGGPPNAEMIARPVLPILTCVGGTTSYRPRFPGSRTRKSPRRRKATRAGCRGLEPDVWRNSHVEGAVGHRERRFDVGRVGAGAAARERPLHVGRRDRRDGHRAGGEGAEVVERRE